MFEIETQNLYQNYHVLFPKKLEKCHRELVQNTENNLCCVEFRASKTLHNKCFWRGARQGMGGDDMSHCVIETVCVAETSAECSLIGLSSTWQLEIMDIRGNYGCCDLRGAL